MLDKDFDNADESTDDARLNAATGSVVTLDARVASTPIDLVKLGLTELAYIRRATINNVPGWSIHSAAGHPMGAAETFEQAWAAVKQHNLEPLRVH
ncbi:MAG: hypothetical protein EXQ84_05045 [Rhodospirillaceae bacterium]|nr:hypothetical protein [Rhodospirillaceae bacterium]